MSAEQTRENSAALVGMTRQVCLAAKLVVEVAALAWAYCQAAPERWSVVPQ